MIVRPVRTIGAWFGLIMGTIVFTFTLWGIGFSLGPEDASLKMLLYIPAFLFIGIFAVLVLGAFTMTYRIKDDNLIIYWGLRSHKIPFSEINEIKQITGRSNLYSILGFSWPGYMIGLYNSKGLGPVRMYATNTYNGYYYIKTNLGLYGITPRKPEFIEELAKQTGKEIEIIDMEEMPRSQRGQLMCEDGYYKLLYNINIILLAVFALYLAIFFPGSGAPSFVVLLLVLAVALFFFNIGNAARLYHFSDQGGYFLLLLGIAVTGTFIILSLSEISL